MDTYWRCNLISLIFSSNYNLNQFCICTPVCLINLEDSKGVYSVSKGILQGMVDGSASKPALRQDTGYMVEKTYPDIAPYLGAFGAY